MSVKVSGNLSVTYINGRNGKFPIATITSSLGRFDVRDDWLKTLDAGNYRGDFTISNITLFNYYAFNELRVSQRAYIDDYNVDKLSTGSLDKPKAKSVSDKTVAPQKSQVKAKQQKEKVVFQTDEELAAENLLRNCKPEDEVWSVGQPYIIDKSMSRQRILECTDALKILDYSLDVVMQTWNQRGDV